MNGTPGKWRVLAFRWENASPVRYYVYFDTLEQALQELSNRGLLYENGAVKHRDYMPKFVTLFDMIQDPR